MENKEKVEIRGILVYDVEAEKHRFLDYFDGSEFTDGVYKSEYSHYVFVKRCTIEFVPETRIDVTQEKLRALDEEGKKLREDFHCKLHAIEVRRNNLLAIEMDPQPVGTDGGFPF